MGQRKREEERKDGCFPSPLFVFRTPDFNAIVNCHSLFPLFHQILLFSIFWNGPYDAGILTGNSRRPESVA